MLSRGSPIVQIMGSNWKRFLKQNMAVTIAINVDKQAIQIGTAFLFASADDVPPILQRQIHILTLNHSTSYVLIAIYTWHR